MQSKQQRPIQVSCRHPLAAKLSSALRCPRKPLDQPRCAAVDSPSVAPILATPQAAPVWSGSAYHLHLFSQHQWCSSRMPASSTGRPLNPLIDNSSEVGLTALLEQW